jgi:hypothetical protein
MRSAVGLRPRGALYFLEGKASSLKGHQQRAKLPANQSVYKGLKRSREDKQREMLEEKGGMNGPGEKGEERRDKRPKHRRGK